MSSTLPRPLVLNCSEYVRVAFQALNEKLACLSGSRNRNDFSPRTPGGHSQWWLRFILFYGSQIV